MVYIIYMQPLPSLIPFSFLYAYLYLFTPYQFPSFPCLLWLFHCSLSLFSFLSSVAVLLLFSLLILFLFSLSSFFIIYISISITDSISLKLFFCSLSPYVSPSEGPSYLHRSLVYFFMYKSINMAQY